MANLSDVEREARRLALEAALRTHGEFGVDGIATAAAKYLKFLLGE